MPFNADGTPVPPQEHVFVPYIWRRQLAIIRLLLGLICAVAQLYYPLFPIPVVPAVILLYCAWALGVVVSRSLERINYTLSSLLIDFLLFVVMSLNPAPEIVWLTHIVYFFLLINSALLFDYRRVALVSFACLWFLLFRRPIHWDQLSPIVLLAGTLAVILSLLKRQLQDRITGAFKRAVLARGEAEVARTQERERLAHDFHDGPLQCYISFQMRMELVRKLLEKGQHAQATSELIRMQEIAVNQVNELRLFVRNMRPPEWDGENASAGFRAILKNFHKDTGIQVTYSADEALTVEDQSTFTELLQVFREALYNIQKHSHASRAAISLEKNQGRLTMRIEDNGGGFPFAGEFTLEELDALRLGPVSIKRRVRALGGSLRVHSRPGEGARLLIEVPV